METTICRGDGHGGNGTPECTTAREDGIKMSGTENGVLPGRVTMGSPAEAKVELFRRLFRGREDVFARQFESRKTGKSGYQPMCGNEWIRGGRGKPKVRCAACPQRAFVPVSDRTAFWHLRGKDDAGRAFTMGVYPMLADETVRFAALDFDKASWRADAAAVREAAREMGHEAAVERSRSGNGAHLWFFFEEPVPARDARDFVSRFLSAALERSPGIGLDSYDPKSRRKGSRYRLG